LKIVLLKLQFITRISTSDSGSVTKECVNYYMLSQHEFSDIDMLSMYALRPADVNHGDNRLLTEIETMT